MRYLLDTHILFWAMSEENKIPEKILDLINNRENAIFFSIASVWEVVIKHEKNPQKMPVSGQKFLNECFNAGFIPLSIEYDHVLAVSNLHRSNNEPQHNDPFDKLLISQAKVEEMIFIAHDKLLAGYSEKCVMTI